ncbi:MAG: GerMN domain-containing protein, partial [Chloroflexota bacterium]|nr:GerMN domain-containing protein [Chloroflexota bacterium]
MTDERHDDEVLGRALSRAIETQTPNQTPFERSRVGSAPTRRGFPIWQTLSVAAALVLALAFGSWFTRPTDRVPVAASPSASSTTAARTPDASASPTPSVTNAFVYLSRDSLPPIGVRVGVPVQAAPEDRIASRLAVILQNSDPRKFPNVGPIPSGAGNAVRTTTTAYIAAVSEVKIQGALATVDFSVPTDSWGITSSAMTVGAVQQLVYTATEEPGIRRVLITQNRGKTASIDGGMAVLDKPLTREDVIGGGIAYVGSTTPASGYGDASKAAARKLTTTTSVETIGPGLARFVITTDLQINSPTVSYPDFKVEVLQNDEAAKPLGGKWRMVVTVNGIDATTGTQVVDKTPLRAVTTLSEDAVKCPACSGT